MIGAGVSDIDQGGEEFFLGMSGDSTTQTRNGMSDLFYDGNDTIYHLSTGVAAFAESAVVGAESPTGLVKEGLGSISGKEYIVTQTGIDNVKKYLIEQGFINDYENQAMLERLEQALANGEKITGADAVYYTHELKEAQLVASGMEQGLAHQTALQFYGVSPYSVYHPDVIKMQPEWWNDAWYDFWEIER